MALREASSRALVYPHTSLPAPQPHSTVGRPRGVLLLSRMVRSSYALGYGN